MPISWNPIHYILAGAIILLMVSLGYSQVLKTRLQLCTARSEAFVAQTNAAAQAQIILNTQENAKRGMITQTLEEKNAKLQNDLAQQYADSRRLLNASTSRSRMPSVPATPTGAACEQGQSYSVETIHEFEGRILDILEQGDGAIEEAKTLEDWVDQQKALAQQYPHGLVDM